MKKTIVILGVIVLITTILMRLHLSLIRYFDADEFAYMHWAWLLAQGKLPYRDFFFYSTPTYPLLLTPIFLFPAHENLLLITRLSQLIMTLLTGLIIYKISRTIVSSFAFCLMPYALFLVFPMILDKTTDIRPDTLMTLTYLVAVYLMITKGGEGRIFWAGFWAGLSLVIFPKMIFGLPALGFLLLTLRKWRLDKQSWAHTLKDVLKFCAGFSLPVLVLAGYLMTNGLMPQFITSITKYSVIVNSGKLPFNFLTGLSPWPLVYLDRGGISWPWMVNTILWLLSIPGLLILFKKNTRLAIFIVLYFTGGIVFLYLFPAPYIQYFIPLVPFISILAGLNYCQLPKIPGIQRIPGIDLLMIISSICLLLISFFEQYQVRVRAENTNREQLTVVRNVLIISQPSDTFYDMVGSYVFRPDGYFICCHPYAEFAPSLPVKIFSLRESLEKNKTKYLIMDRTGLLFWKPKIEDLEYLKDNFVASPYPKIYIPLLL